MCKTASLLESDTTRSTFPFCSSRHGLLLGVPLSPFWPTGRHPVSSDQRSHYTQPLDHPCRSRQKPLSGHHRSAKLQRTVAAALRSRDIVPDSGLAVLEDTPGIRLVGSRLLGSRLLGSRLLGSHLPGIHLPGIHWLGSHWLGSHLLGSHLLGSHLLGTPGWPGTGWPDSPSSPGSLGTLDCLDSPDMLDTLGWPVGSGTSGCPDILVPGSFGSLGWPCHRFDSDIVLGCLGYFGKSESWAGNSDCKPGIVGSLYSHSQPGILGPPVPGLPWHMLAGD